MARLDGKFGLVVGIANEQSIAWSCTREFRSSGATLGATWQTEKSRTHVEPLLDLVDAPLRMPLDVQDDEQLGAVFEKIGRTWGRLDFFLHAVAFAPKDDLHGRLTDSSREGFLTAMDVSCHSFVRMARLAAPLMREGGSMLAMSYLGSERVVPNYGLMGPVKAALECTVRYLAGELGPSGIRVNVVSPGAIPTRASSGLHDFDALVADSIRRAPLHRPLSIDDVGPLCAFLVSDEARAITGSTLYVDGGYHILN